MPGAKAPETVSAVVTPALSAAGYGVKVATLAADPVAALGQVRTLMDSGMVVVMGPEVGGTRVEGERKKCELLPVP